MRKSNQGTIQNWTLIVIIILLFGGGIFVWQYWQKPEEGEINLPIVSEQEEEVVEEKEKEVVSPAAGEPEEEVTPLKEATAGWKTYRNEKYGFEVKYPAQNWQTQGGKDMYEIRNGGAFVKIGVAERNIDISLEDWFKKQHEYYLNIPDGNSIYAEPYNLDKVVDYDFNGIPVKRTTPISFDYSGVSFYFKKGANILYIEYSKNDPNDRNFARKFPVIEQILSTFKFIEIETNETQQELKQTLEEMIDKFMKARIKRDGEAVLLYLTKDAVLGLGGAIEAKLYLIGPTNPHIYKYEITLMTEYPKGTLNYPEGGYKVIVKCYEEYTGQGGAGSFIEGFNLIEINGQWFINEVIKRQPR